jgi:hypothetical protein
LTGSTSLGAAIHSIIGLIPYEWSRIVKLKICEPFHVIDWVIKRSELQSPLDVFSICHVLPKKSIGVKFAVKNDGTLPDTNLKVTLSKSHIVKACVLATNTLDSRGAHFPKFCGNCHGAIFNLLFSQIRWIVDDNSIDFASFLVRSAY